MPIRVYLRSFADNFPIMPREFPRHRRVAELIQHEIAVLIQRDFSDPGAALITVSSVDVSPDLRNAKIFVTALGDAAQRPKLIKHLNEQAGHFRHGLGEVLRLRTVPHLKFAYDETLERGNRISELLDSVRNRKGD